MTYTREQAVKIMNTWGCKHIPFWFIIDFEMKAICIFRADEPLPSTVHFAFPGSEVNKKQRDGEIFSFRKYPVSFAEYNEAFLETRKQIISGNSFLLNLTFPTGIETNLSLQEIFEYGKGKYKLWVENEFVVFSPETFITIKNGIISSYPMKGTINAAIPNAKEVILNNPKETAEHYTIVDLIRNDLSMIAKDVVVKRVRYIDRIQTHQGDILQVSSEIVGKLPEDYCRRIGTIIFTLLPAGSVTGAPKRKTVQVIKQIEKTPRGYYTGICGHFDGQDLDSAVMIRFIMAGNGKLWFHSGGGITCNSEVQTEYQELIDKVYVPIV